MSAIVYFYSRHQKQSLELATVISRTPDLSIVTTVRADDLQTRKRLVGLGVKTMPCVVVTNGNDVSAYEREDCYTFLSKLIDRTQPPRQPSQPPPSQPPKQTEEEKEFGSYMSTGKVNPAEIMSRAKAEREIEEAAVNTKKKPPPKIPKESTSVSNIQSGEISDAPFSMEVVEGDIIGGGENLGDSGNSDDPSGMGFKDGDTASRIAALEQSRG
jgi:hypothetical protein